MCKVDMHVSATYTNPQNLVNQQNIKFREAISERVLIFFAKFQIGLDEQPS